MLSRVLATILLLVVHCHALAESPNQLRLHPLDVDKLDMVTVINSVTQDSQGYLWVSGISGVLKFDGYHSIFYPLEQARKVVEDAQGRRWLLTGNGLYLYCHVTDKFNRFLSDMHQDDMHNSSLFRDSYSIVRHIDSKTFRPTELYQDSQNKLWLVGDDGRLIHFSADQEQYESYDFPSSLIQHNLRFGITFFNDLPLFVSKDGKVYSLDKTTGSFNVLFQDSRLVNTRIVTAGLSNTVHLVSDHGLFILDLSEPNQKSLTKLDIDPRSISFVHVGHHATFIGTNKSLIVLDADNHVNRVSSYYSDGLQQNIFGVQNVFDDERAVWLSTSKGLYQVKFAQTTQANGYAKASLNATKMPMIESLLVDKRDNLWIVSQRRVYLKKANTGLTEAIELDANRPDVQVQTAFETRDGSVVFGGASELYQYDMERQRFRRIPLPLDPVKMGKEVRDIEQSENGHLWLLTFQGVAEYIPAKNEIVSFQPGHFKNLKKGPNGTVLACGFETYILGKGKAEKVDFQLEETIKQLVVYDASVDQSGRLWAATSHGLLLHEMDTKSTRKLDLNGVYPNVVFAFTYRDNGGHIWLIDMTNIYKVEPDTMEVVFTEPVKRLSIGAKTYGSVSESSSGTLFLGGVSGFATLENTTTIAPYGVHFSRVIVQGQSYPVYQAEPGLENTISLGTQFTSAQRNVKFEFVNIKRDPNVDIYYQYRLIGFDNEWTEVDQTQRNATYTNLPSGDYEFVIKSRSISSQWTESRFKFSIATPYYLTVWAFLFYAVCLVLLIALILIVRTHQLKRHNLQLETQVRARTEEIEQKRVQIANLMESKNKLFGNISHELRTPLSVIMLPLKSMLKQNPDKENISWHAAYSQAVRLEKLIDNLIRYARKDNFAPPENHQFTARVVLMKQIQAFDLLAHEKQIQIKTDICLTCQEVVLNEADFELVVTNLLSNAVKYTPDGGLIQVSAQQKGNMLVLMFSNSGPGIDPSLQADIFKRYVRGTHNDIAGQGIGLSVVHQLISGCGGVIELTSESGKGCLFTLHIPVFLNSHDEFYQKDLITTQHNASDSENTDKLERILIVEDNPDLRMMLNEALSVWFNCTVAGDGEQGLAIAKNILPDLIVSDVMMPVMTGLDMLRAIKQDEMTSHIPVVLLTAKEDDASRIIGFEAEADDYMGKPFDIDVLRIRIENLIKGRKKLAHLYRHHILHGENIAQPRQEEKRAPFIDKLHYVIAQHYQDPEFDTEHMASLVFLSTRQLQRKSRSLTGLSPIALLRQYRLQQACKQLRAGTLVADVAYQVGFSSPGYFSSCFKAEFSVSPQQYVRQFAKAAYEDEADK